MILPHAGVETSARDHVENWIPYVAMGRLFHECARVTVCWMDGKEIASLGCAMYQKDAEFVEQIYEAFLTGNGFQCYA